MSFTEIEEKLLSCNEQHLLAFWNDLSKDEQEVLLFQLTTINFEKALNLFQTAKDNSNKVKKLDNCIKPIPPERFESELKLSEEERDKYYLGGLKNISNGKVAVILLAGGQGSRLSYNSPKGMFPLDLQSRNTLFQIQAEQIRRLEKLAEEKIGESGKICWFIMTSQTTHGLTEEYFQKHQYFGLDRNNVVIFQQDTLPCFTFNGKMILDERNQVALAPNGNGGIFTALRNNNILDIMRKRNIKYVHVHSVDNILVKVGDPVFLGYCITKKTDCGVKVISKENPNEELGVVCEVNGKFQIVKNNQITEKTANLRDKEGNLIFQAISICNHFFTTDFLEKVTNLYENELQPHIAKKKIPYVDKHGIRIKPSLPNGIKIEKFIYDVFEFSENFVVWEVPRVSEFSPLKNCEDVLQDCPSTCYRDLFQLHKSYVERAGGIVLCDHLEISPLLSYAGENLIEKVKGKVFDSPTLLLSDEEINSLMD